MSKLGLLFILGAAAAVTIGLIKAKQHFETVHTVEADQPEKPEADQPEEPDADQPAEPDADQPENPEADQPEEPDADQPENPDAGQPENPDADHPAAPDAGQPENPDAGQPAEPGSGTPEPEKSAKAGFEDEVVIINGADDVPGGTDDSEDILVRADEDDEELSQTARKTLDKHYNRSNGTLEELLGFLRDNTPNFYKFTLVSASSPVTIFTDVLDGDMTVMYSSGISVNRNNDMVMVNVKNGDRLRWIISGGSYYTVNDREKSYTCKRLSDEELAVAQERLKNAFSVSNYDLSSIKAVKGIENIGGKVYDAELIDDGRNGCVIFADRDTGRIKYMRSGGYLSEVKRYDNESADELFGIDAGYTLIPLEG